MTARREAMEFVNAGALLNAHQGALRLVQAVLVVMYLVVRWVVGWSWSLWWHSSQGGHVVGFPLAGARSAVVDADDERFECLCPCVTSTPALTVNSAHSLSHTILTSPAGTTTTLPAAPFVASGRPSSPARRTSSIPPARGARKDQQQSDITHATPRRLTTTQKHGVIKGQGVCEAHMVW